MSEVKVLYTYKENNATTRLAGLTDDCVVASLPNKNKNKVLFVPKNGGEAIVSDVFPTSGLFPADAHGDFAVIQQAAPRKLQSSFLLKKDGNIVELDKGSISKPNVFASRIDEFGVYGEVRNTTQIVYCHWDLSGKIVVSSNSNYIAGTLNNVPIMNNLLVDLPSNLGESMALYVVNGWVIGRAYEKNESGVAKKTTASSVSWLWNMDNGLKICTMPDGRKLSITTVSVDGRYVVGLAWTNNSPDQQAVLLDLEKSKYLGLEELAGCSDGGMADWSNAKFDSDGSLYLRRIAVLNGPMEIVKITI